MNIQFKSFLKLVQYDTVYKAQRLYEANTNSSIFREVKYLSQITRLAKQEIRPRCRALSAASWCLPVVIIDLNLAGLTDITCSCRRKTWVHPLGSGPSCCQTQGSLLQQPRKGIPGPEFHQTLHSQRSGQAP